MPMYERDVRDQRQHEPRSAKALEQEFPQWEVWKGVSRLWYARLLKSSPPVVVKGEGLMDVRDQIIVWIRRHEN